MRQLVTVILVIVALLGPLLARGTTLEELQE